MAVSIGKVATSFIGGSSTRRVLNLIISRGSWIEALRVVNHRNFCKQAFIDQTTTTTTSSSSSRVSVSGSEDCSNVEEFEKWHNGGGIFHKSAEIDPTALIEIGAIVHSKSVLGANVHIQSGAIVGPAVTIGQLTKIGYNSAVSNCSIGDSCLIHNGACIGQDGFGFFVDEQGNMLKKPQTLHARIGNHVEIGSNTCIDRGSWRDTVIGDHTKIDNLVQIGHNVVIGKCCMLCGQVGIAGSVTMGDYVTLGGRVAVRDHVNIAAKSSYVSTFAYHPVGDLSDLRPSVLHDRTCYMLGVDQSLLEPSPIVYVATCYLKPNPFCTETDMSAPDPVQQQVRLAANSCVTKDIKEPGDYSGFPAVPIHEWRRQVATLRSNYKKGIS